MPDELPVAYVIRIGEAASEVIERTAQYFYEWEGERIASAWENNLYDFMATFAQLPHRYPFAPESRRFKYEVRSTTYRRAPGSAPYRVVFTIVEEDAAAKIGEAPFVLIMPLRHGAARPMTRAEAREIEERTALLPPPSAN